MFVKYLHLKHNLPLRLCYPLTHSKVSTGLLKYHDRSRSEWGGGGGRPHVPRGCAHNHCYICTIRFQRMFIVRRVDTGISLTWGGTRPAGSSIGRGRIQRLNYEEIQEVPTQTRSSLGGSVQCQPIKDPG